MRTGERVYSRRTGQELTGSRVGDGALLRKTYLYVFEQGDGEGTYSVELALQGHTIENADIYVGAVGAPRLLELGKVVVDSVNPTKLSFEAGPGMAAKIVVNLVFKGTANLHGTRPAFGPPQAQHFAVPANGTTDDGTDVSVPAGCDGVVDSLNGNGVVV